MLISKKEISELHTINEANCISIFIPNHRDGKKVLQEEDRLYLKIQFKNVRNKLSYNGVHNDTINKLTAPIQELIDNRSFWRNQSDGLAIFVANGFFRKYTLPVHFKELNYIANSFNLKPLIPMFVNDGKFYLMALGSNDVKLHECTKDSLSEIIIDDLIHENEQYRVDDDDYEENNLQFRKQQVGSNHITYHGQEIVTSKRKNEIKKYFKAIDDCIKPILIEYNLPLLIASQDYLFDIYCGVNTYEHLFDQHIKGCTDIVEAHKRAWQIIAPTFEQTRKDKITQFHKSQGADKTNIDISEILNAAFSGRIDTLFCEKLADIFGNYKKENDTIIVTETNENSSSISLMNFVAIKTILKDGKVYLLDKEEMPNTNSKVNALYR